MNPLSLLKSIAISLLSSATPNFFGARRSRELEKSFQKDWNATQENIDVLGSMNPFQSAAAKSAMAKASQNANQMKNRMLNSMGAGASPESVIAASGETNQALGAAAGQIATGAEANKNTQLNALRSLKSQQMNQHSQQITNTAQANAMTIEAFGKFLEGAGGVAGLF